MRQSTQIDRRQGEASECCTVSVKDNSVSSPTHSMVSPKANRIYFSRLPPGSQPRSPMPAVVKDLRLIIQAKGW